MFKNSPEIAQTLGALGEGALLMCPWLLDQKTMDLLSKAGYDPNQDGKIYTGLRVGITTITLVIAVALTVGIVSPIVSILEFLVIGVGVWLIPNLILANSGRR